MTKKLIIAALCAAAATANATVVRVDVVGEVDFNVIRSGQFAGMAPGTPATMSFLLDSNNFQNGTLFPTRGYVIDEASFDLTIGGSSAGMASPYPAGQTPYFILRNNDPAVDGFLLGSNPDAGFPDGVWTDSPALIDTSFHALFLATYGGSTLSSLDIVDAAGTYTFAGLTVFNWGLDDAGNQPMGLIFDHFTIEVVPAPASAGLLLGLGGLALRRRR